MAMVRPSSSRGERREAKGSNIALEEWPATFANDLLASAALDRLTHHAYTLTIRGESYRQKTRREENLGTSTAPPAENL